MEFLDKLTTRVEPMKSGTKYFRRTEILGRGTIYEF